MVWHWCPWIYQGWSQDITAKFNQTTSPTSSRKKLKPSLSKKRDIYNENDDDSNQTLETTDMDVKTNDIDDTNGRRY